MSNDILQTKCIVCNEIAHEPIIECCECDANLCTSCFTSGREVGTHKNDHKYAIRRNDFPLFDNCNWSAKEECKLLSALSVYGYGNWEEISKNVHTRTKLECQEHYKKYYVENVQFDELKLFPETEQSLFPHPITPYLYNNNYSTNPPRNNQTDQRLAGYNAYRSEFEFSYDQNAETIISLNDDCSDDDDDCMDALNISLVRALNTRMQERRRRYNIIKNHGLIILNKFTSWLQRFEMTLTKFRTVRLIHFMQFMSGMQFDAFMESLSLEVELSQRIFKLCEYRRNGIKTFYGIKIFKQLRKEHEISLKEQKSLTWIMMNKYDLQSVKDTIMFCKNKKRLKRMAAPLEIEDLPGFHLLCESERVLCSHLRLLPENYLEIKEQLISENNKIGYLRLLDARKIIKIDVNKTRKIYDYLLSEGFLSQPVGAALK